MLQPELSFSSNPPQDESDILSLIIFGMPTNELGEGQQVALAVRAQELAGGYLASGLSEAIGGALNLDEFEIQAAGRARPRTERHHRSAGEQGIVRPPAPGVRRRAGDRVHSRISARAASCGCREPCPTSRARRSATRSGASSAAAWI